MPQINLAAEVFRARLVARRRRVFYGLSVALLLLLVGSWGLPLLLQRGVRQEIGRVEEEITAVEAELRAREAQVRAIRLFAERLGLLRARLDAQVGWSSLLAELERTVTPFARLKKLSGAVGTGSVTADVAVPSLDAAADLIASLQRVVGANETFFTRVDVISFAFQEGAVDEAARYTVGLRLAVPPSHFTVAGVP